MANPLHLRIGFNSSVDKPNPAAIGPVMSPDVCDLGLVRRAAATGDRRAEHEAFARLYDRHAPVVRALCRAHQPTEEDADDALQEAFLRALRMLDRVEDPAGFRPWLYAIARRVCAERRRSSTRRDRHVERAAALNAIGGTAMSTLASELVSETAASKSEDLDRLGRAIAQLPDDERLAVHLYYLDADPVSAAVECLGVSRSGFYKLLSRARERLSSLLAGSQSHE